MGEGIDPKDTQEFRRNPKMSKICDKKWIGQRPIIIMGRRVIQFLTKFWTLMMRNRHHKTVSVLKLLIIRHPIRNHSQENGAPFNPAPLFVITKNVAGVDAETLGCDA
jgi:hypothetical protein